MAPQRAAKVTNRGPSTRAALPKSANEAAGGAARPRLAGKAGVGGKAAAAHLAKGVSARPALAGARASGKARASSLAQARTLPKTARGRALLREQMLAASRDAEPARLSVGQATGLHALALGDSSALRVGQPVVAIGNALALSGELTATDWAESLDSIDYEIVCGVSARVERRPV